MVCHPLPSFSEIYTTCLFFFPFVPRAEAVSRIVVHPSSLASVGDVYLHRRGGEHTVTAGALKPVASFS